MAIDATRAIASEGDRDDHPAADASPRWRDFKRVVAAARRQRRRSDDAERTSAMALVAASTSHVTSAGGDLSVTHSILDRIEKLAGLHSECDASPARLSRWDSVTVSLGRRLEILVHATDGEVAVTIAAPPVIASQVAARRRELAGRLERRGWRVGRIRILRLTEQPRDRT